MLPLPVLHPSDVAVASEIVSGDGQLQQESFPRYARLVPVRRIVKSPYVATVKVNGHVPHPLGIVEHFLRDRAHACIVHTEVQVWIPYTLK